MTAAKTVRVAGANGLVGSAVVRRMCASDITVIAAADLNDQDSCAELFGSVTDVTHQQEQRLLPPA